MQLSIMSTMTLVWRLFLVDAVMGCTYLSPLIFLFLENRIVRPLYLPQFKLKKGVIKNLKIIYRIFFFILTVFGAWNLILLVFDNVWILSRGLNPGALPVVEGTISYEFSSSLLSQRISIDNTLERYHYLPMFIFSDKLFYSSGYSIVKGEHLRIYYLPNTHIALFLE